ncbi:MAG TPA: hypothetical protein VFM79_04880 [Pelobium sp.]|nr:hypothetical protein [Pelobium sp.]
MSAILENQLTPTFSPTRFTQVKRINNNNEVNSFYSDCVRRLRNAPQWNYMSLLNLAYKITAHDSMGLPVNRELEKGDYLKVIADTDGKGKRFFWLLVDDVQHQKELDLSEESVGIMLREIENPNLITELSAINATKGKYELHLRRLINTISIDVKIINQQTIDQSKSFLNYFKWEAFSKQILLQL